MRDWCGTLETGTDPDLKQSWPTRKSCKGADQTKPSGSQPDKHSRLHVPLGRHVTFMKGDEIKNEGHSANLSQIFRPSGSRPGRQPANKNETGGMKQGSETGGMKQGYETGV
jgi:hypothetical protein